MSSIKPTAATIPAPRKKPNKFGILETLLVSKTNKTAIKNANINDNPPILGIGFA